MTDRSLARGVLLVSIGVAWLNYLLTARWAAIAGSIHGAKEPFYVAALVLVSLLAWTLRGERVDLGRVPAVVCAGGCAFLLVVFFLWFPPSAWNAVPFLDDWPPRFQSTVDGLALLRRGAFSGWRWDFLGGYPVVTDVTQDLTIWAAVPMALCGAAPGFHLTHLVLFACIPALTWWDLRRDGEDSADLALVAAGLSAVIGANYSYFLMRSGDTNSLAGVVATLMAVVAARAARSGVRGGALALVCALTLANYSHRGFFIYAVLFLALDAVVAVDPRSARRAAVAVVVALIAGLPVTWDLYRYPSYFIANNVSLTPVAFSLGGFLRKVYYNVELLVLPGRWFNDFTGLTNIFLSVIAYVAWRARGRARFYAAATLGAVALVRLFYESFGYLFLRPILLLAVFLGPALAWFILRRAGRRPLALALLAFIAIYVQVWFGPVPHVRDVREFNPGLVAELTAAAGEMVLIENGWHRDADTSLQAISVRTPFPAHFEALLPSMTGKRLYGGMWDGWQWTPYRDQVLANGSFRGRALSDVDVADVEAELRRWNVAHLFVWSADAGAFFERSDRFALVWTDGQWRHFAYRDAAPAGPASLVAHDLPGGRVRLAGVQHGQTVTLPANFHPAWRATAGDQRLDLFNANGQLAFAAPRDGSYDVVLEYPRRPWLTVLAVVALLGGAWATRFV
jgi:hypothetical protein